MTKTYKHVRREVDRHGKVRFYYRKDGTGPRVALPSPDAPDFAERYAAAVASDPTPKRPRAPSIVRPSKGTLGWLCSSYFASAEFRLLDPETQKQRRRLIEHGLREPIAPGASEVFSDFPLDRLTYKAARVLRDRKADFPNAANNRMKAFGYAFKWGLDAEPDVVKSNPVRDLPKLKVQQGGHHSWSIEEVEQFERVHPIGTKARLAMSLLLYTGQRRSDIIRLGRPMVRDGWLYFRQWKNRNRNPVDMAIPIIPTLQDVIDATNPVGVQTWLVTSFGKPFTAAGFGNKFREWCNEAKLPHCSAHGLRKAIASRLAELGCSDHEIMSITGHQTLQEVTRYTKAARRKVMAEAVAARFRHP